MKYCLLSLLLCSIPTAMAAWKPAAGRMLTSWGTQLDSSAVWAEYPRPQLQRENWTNLNGLWRYSIAGKGDDVTGKARLLAAGTDKQNGTAKSQLLSGEILVPFCPESALSGVGRLVEPGESLWYRRRSARLRTHGATIFESAVHGSR